MENVSCYSNQRSHPTVTKTHIFVSPTYMIRCYISNMKRIDLRASEEKPFENVQNERRLTAAGFLHELKTTFKFTSNLSIILQLKLPCVHMELKEYARKDYLLFQKKWVGETNI